MTTARVQPNQRPARGVSSAARVEDRPQGRSAAGGLIGRATDRLSPTIPPVCCGATRRGRLGRSRPTIRESTAVRTQIDRPQVTAILPVILIDDKDQEPEEAGRKHGCDARGRSSGPCRSTRDARLEASPVSDEGARFVVDRPRGFRCREMPRVEIVRGRALVRPAGRHAEQIDGGHGSPTMCSSPTRAQSCVEVVPCSGALTV